MIAVYFNLPYNIGYLDKARLGMLNFLWSSKAGKLMLFYVLGPIAQLAEQPAHNRSVPGSSPGGPTTMKAPSSNRLGHQPFKLAAGVQIP